MVILTKIVSFTPNSFSAWNLFLTRKLTPEAHCDACYCSDSYSVIPSNPSPPEEAFGNKRQSVFQTSQVMTKQLIEEIAMT